MGIKLSNDSLEIVIASPYSVYKGSRFDGSGIITDIQFAGHSFCQVEQKEAGKGSGGIGFCNEFGIDQPIDYKKVLVGESFPKIGVGMVTKKSEEDYDFFSPYTFDKCRVSEKHIDGHSYEVTSIIDDKKAYQLSLTKTISIKDNFLIIDYVLQNNGLTIVKTNEYNHNFIGIDTDNIGKDYCINFPNVIEVDKKAGIFEISKDQDGTTINWDIDADQDFYALMKLANKTCSYNWELKHSKTRLGIRDCSDFPVSKMALWGFNHVICPEVFVDISVGPKETMSWSRKYEFFTY